MSKEKYIGLKEAARLSGYSPDYVGQLIRRGKLPGKQVFLNVAWVTTEEALLKYMEQQKSGKTPGSSAATYWKALTERVSLDLVYKVAFGLVFAVLLGFILLLFYILSVSVDHRIEQNYQQQLEGSV